MLASVTKNISRALKFSANEYGVKNIFFRRMSSQMANFETLAVTTPKEYVFQVQLNRPEKRNSMNQTFWKEMVTCFNQLSTNADCRVIVLSGAGKMFTSGLDVMDTASLLIPEGDVEVGRRATKLRTLIEDFQQSFSVIEKCPKPVIAAIHNACIGGGVDLISACDIRYCTRDAWFQIKEIDLGLAADVGTLQRLPKIVACESLVRELAFTGGKLLADEAFRCGLVSRIFDDKESMLSAALELAALIATKSPIAVQGTKVNLIYSRDHPVADSLHYMAVWNQAMLQSDDLTKAAGALFEKKAPSFSKL